MANDFLKNSLVLFSEQAQDFETQTEIFNHIKVYNPGREAIYKSGGAISRPMPMQLQAILGEDVTNKYKKYGQLAVPIAANSPFSVPLDLSGDEIADEELMSNIIKSALDGLQSSMYTTLVNILVNTSGHVYTKTSGIDITDIAKISTRFAQEGIVSNQMGGLRIGVSGDSYVALYDKIASKATEMGDKATNSGTIPMTGGYELVQLPILPPTSASNATAGTFDNTSSGGNYYVPKGMNEYNQTVDNRFQTVTFASLTGSPAVNDRFEVAGSYAVDMKSKTRAPHKRTHTITKVIDATNRIYQITPPMITAQGGTDIEKDYQNTVVVTPSATAAVTFLNSVEKYGCPFWVKDAIELTPYEFTSAKSNLIEKSIRLDNGLQVQMTIDKDANSNRYSVIFRVRAVMTNLRPDWTGIFLPSQTVGN